ncbi:MAG: hypothetical protein ACYDH4_10915 [Candidatus Cryosericum sp.]
MRKVKKRTTHKDQLRLPFSAENMEALRNRLTLQDLVRICDMRGFKLVPFVGDPEPIPQILFCPSCSARHVDVGVFATKPHHTHACQKCGVVWRPAIVATVGVQFLPGFKDP